jgi:hypothetical protein
MLQFNYEKQNEMSTVRLFWIHTSLVWQGELFHIK